MGRINNIYPLQLWLTTITIVAPILLSIAAVINDYTYFKNSDNIGVIFLFIGLGLVFSFPMFMICFISFKLLVYKQVPPFFIKLILDLICIAGVVATFCIISGSMAFISSLIYSASIIISSLFYKVYIEKRASKNNGNYPLL